MWILSIQRRVPAELNRQIIQNVERRRDLVALSSVCRAFQIEAERQVCSVLRPTQRAAYGRVGSVPPTNLPPGLLGLIFTMITGYYTTPSHF